LLLGQAKGQPDVSTRMVSGLVDLVLRSISCTTEQFLSRLKATLKLPIMALVDRCVDGAYWKAVAAHDDAALHSDPYGLKILSVYVSGSKNMSYDSANLTTVDVHWLGVRPSDFDKFDIPEVRMFSVDCC
jgi:hypothetical protein